MKEINGKIYYTKLEVCDIMGVTIHALNAILKRTKVRGYQLGRFLHYTPEQIDNLILTRKPHKRRILKEYK